MSAYGSGNAAIAAARRSWETSLASTSCRPCSIAPASLEIFRSYFGPIKLAFDRVGPDGEAALADRREQLEKCNTAGNRAFVLEPEYLQVIATTRAG